MYFRATALLPVAASAKFLSRWPADEAFAAAIMAMVVSILALGHSMEYALRVIGSPMPARCSYFVRAPPSPAAHFHLAGRWLVARCRVRRLAAGTR